MPGNSNPSLPPQKNKCGVHNKNKREEFRKGLQGIHGVKSVSSTCFTTPCPGSSKFHTRYLSVPDLYCCLASSLALVFLNKLSCGSYAVHRRCPPAGRFRGVLRNENNLRNATQRGPQQPATVANRTEYCHSKITRLILRAKNLPESFRRHDTSVGATYLQVR